MFINLQRKSDWEPEIRDDPFTRMDSTSMSTLPNGFLTFQASVASSKYASRHIGQNGRKGGCGLKYHIKSRVLLNPG